MSTRSRPRYSSRWHFAWILFAAGISLLAASTAHANPMWNKLIDGPGGGDDEAYQVVAGADDSDDGLYVCGRQTGANDSSNLVVIKFDQQGNRLWEAVHDSHKEGGAGGYDTCTGIAAAPGGGVVVTGMVGGRHLLPWESDLESEIDTQQRPDVFTARYGPDGVQMWSDRYGVQSGSSDTGVSVAVGPADSVYVAALSESSSSERMHVVRYNLQSGSRQWTAEAMPTPWKVASFHDQIIAVDENGDAYLAGSVDAGSSFNLVVLKIGADGQVSWIEDVDRDPGDDAASALTLGPNGNVFVTGEVSSDDTGKQFFVGKFGPDGEPAWTRAADVYKDVQHAKDYSDDELLVGGGIDVDANGDVYVTGYKGTKPAGSDILTMKFAGGDGSRQWRKAFGTGIGDLGADVVLDGNGGLYVAGSTNKGTKRTQFSVLKYSTGGKLQWAQRWAKDKSVGVASSAALTPDGGVVVTGGLARSGTQAYLEAAKDLVVLKYDADEPSNIKDRGPLGCGCNAADGSPVSNIPWMALLFVGLGVIGLRRH